jgi:hypothetical protein
MTGYHRYGPWFLYKPVTTGYSWFFAVFCGPGPVIWPFLLIDNQSGYWFTQKWQKKLDWTGPQSTNCHLGHK